MASAAERNKERKVEQDSTIESPAEDRQAEMDRDQVRSYTSLRLQYSELLSVERLYKDTHPVVWSPVPEFQGNCTYSDHTTATAEHKEGDEGKEQVEDATVESMEKLD